MANIDSLAHDTIDSVARLLADDHVTQALVLLYSAIDTLAWLGAPGPKATRTVFKDWIDKYLLLHTGLQCTAADLYSARCGLLHTSTAESDMTVDGSAREIWYWTGPNSRQYLESRAAGRTDVVLVGVPDFVAAFLGASDAFRADLAEDPTQAMIAEDKVRKWLIWTPIDPAV